jgi:hypothetical protein
VEQSNRPRVKQSLELQQRRLETELINLKEKQEKETTEKKPSAAVPPATTRSYTKEISLYGKTIGRFFPSLEIILSFSLGSNG